MIMLATGDGEARTLFSSQDIGDTDGDGAPKFLRWLGEADPVPPLARGIRIFIAAS